jgi:hypothetical protein
VTEHEDDYFLVIGRLRLTMRQVLLVVLLLIVLAGIWRVGMGPLQGDE